MIAERRHPWVTPLCVARIATREEAERSFHRFAAQLNRRVYNHGEYTRIFFDFDRRGALTLDYHAKVELRCGA